MKEPYRNNNTNKLFFLESIGLMRIGNENTPVAIYYDNDYEFDRYVRPIEDFYANFTQDAEWIASKEYYDLKPSSDRAIALGALQLLWEKQIEPSSIELCEAYRRRMNEVFGAGENK